MTFSISRANGTAVCHHSGDLVLLETQHCLATQLAQANIRLVLESSAQCESGWTRADPTVLINLVQNARQHRHDGTITLRARRDRKPLANGETDVVILEVTDTAKAFPPKSKSACSIRSFTTKDTGTGLGCPSRRASFRTMARAPVSNSRASWHNLWYCVASGN